MNLTFLLLFRRYKTYCYIYLIVSFTVSPLQNKERENRYKTQERNIMNEVIVTKLRKR